MTCTEQNGVGWPERNRRRIVAQADKRIEEARRMMVWANTDGELPDAGWYECWQCLADADNLYRLAGLGVLAGRVAFMARRIAEYRERENFHVAWARFDRLNAGGRRPV
jgi:hypothetical protein